MNGIGGGNVVPGQSLAEESVERFGLLQVHRFSRPVHVRHKRRKTGSADPQWVGLGSERLGNCAALPVHWLVAVPNAQDLFVRAKHLFIGATGVRNLNNKSPAAGPRGKGWG